MSYFLFFFLGDGFSLVGCLGATFLGAGDTFAAAFNALRLTLSVEFDIINLRNIINSCKKQKPQKRGF
tara:strand:- start:51 stop:254 length:204 start_codon:yes stop_codon:yes gene_type:complete